MQPACIVCVRSIVVKPVWLRRKMLYEFAEISCVANAPQRARSHGLQPCSMNATRGSQRTHPTPTPCDRLSGIRGAGQTALASPQFFWPARDASGRCHGRQSGLRQVRCSTQSVQVQRNAAQGEPRLRALAALSRWTRVQSVQQRRQAQAVELRDAVAHGRQLYGQLNILESSPGSSLAETDPPRLAM